MRNIEFNIQKQIFEWANMSIRKYPELKLLNASLNGVKLTSKVAGARAKQSGMKKDSLICFYLLLEKDIMACLLS